MTVENKKVPAYTKKSLRDRWSHDLRHNWWLWVMFLPVVVYYAIFSYAPMYGILMAFKDYKVRRGIWGSPWVGFKYFDRFFSSYNFWILIKNTLGISVYSLSKKPHCDLAIWLLIR